MAWGTDIEIERRNRIHVAVHAYAYEIKNETLISDHEFDALARSIRPEISTGNNQMDRFFRDVFTPDTGVWIRRHPEIVGIRRIYNGLTKGFGDEARDEILSRGRDTDPPQRSAA